MYWSSGSGSMNDDCQQRSNQLVRKIPNQTDNNPAGRNRMGWDGMGMRCDAMRWEVEVSRHIWVSTVILWMRCICRCNAMQLTRAYSLV